MSGCIKMKNNIIVKNIVLLLISILLGTVLMIGIYALPTGRIENNVERSSSLYINGENKINNWVGNLRYGRLDNGTDSTMINAAMCREYDSVIQNAMLNPILVLKSEAVADNNFSNISLLLDENNVESIMNYMRYWHGYLLYLIPGLSIFTVGELRVIMMAVQFIFAVVLLFGVGNKLGARYMVPYIATILFINPITTALNFQNADVYIITMLACICIIYFNDWLNKNHRYILLFTLIGICTAFFDFLTYPIIGYGIPMLTYYLMNKNNLKSRIKDVVFCLIAWGFGFAGMWAGKWIVAGILTDMNVFADVLGAFSLRSGLNNGADLDLSYYTAMISTKESFWDPANAALCILFIISTVGVALLNKDKFKPDFKAMLPMLLVCLSFFIWVFFVRNHYITHQNLEYRSFAIIVLCFYLLIADLFRDKNAV